MNEFLSLALPLAADAPYAHGADRGLTLNTVIGWIFAMILVVALSGYAVLVAHQVLGESFDAWEARVRRKANEGKGFGSDDSDPDDDEESPIW